MIGHEKRMNPEKLTRSSKAQRVNSIDQDKFRSSLSLMEQDRHHLLQSLREVQKKNELEVEKNFELGRNLNYQAEHIKNLESENDELVGKMKSLQSRLEEIESLYNSLVQERSNLKLTVAQLQDEVQVTKMQASDKEVYIENLACSYNDEKETILNVHGKHSKVLTSKILFDSIARVACFRKNWAFGVMRIEGMKKAALGKVFFKILRKMMEKRAKFALRGLKDFVREEKVRVIIERFVEGNRKNKVLKKVWKVFKELANRRLRTRQMLIKGIAKTNIVERSKVKVRVLRFLTQWKNVKVKDLYGRRILWSIVRRKHLKALEIAVGHWEKVQKTLKQLQANEDLASDLSAFTLKQSIFYEFKRITQLSTQRKKLTLFTHRLQVHKNKQKVFTELSLYKSLQKNRKSRLSHLCLYFSNRSLKSSYKKWQSFLKTLKKTSNLSKVFKSHLKHSSFLGVNKFYTAWKLFVIQNKLQRTSKTLASEQPRREKFEQDYSELLSLNHKAMMTKVVQNMMRSSKNILRSYWFTWEGLVFSFNQSKKRISLKFCKVYTQLCQDSFIAWKEFVKKSRLAQLANSHQEVNDENQVLLEHISNLEACLKGTTEAKTVVSVLNMAKSLNVVQRKTKINKFRKWAQVALKVSNYLNGGQRIESIFYFNLVGFGLDSLKMFHQQKARKEVLNKKLYVFTFKKWKKFNGFMIENWLNFVRLNKYHRAKMTKILSKKYRKTLFFSISSWQTWLHLLNRNEGEVRFEVLENQFNQVREELEDVCNSLSIEKDKTWTLEELLRFKYLRRLVLSLKSIHTRVLKKSIFQWTGFVTCQRLKLKYLIKILNYNKKFDIKACIQVWLNQKNLANRMKSTSNISSLVAEKKNLRRDMNSLKVNLETQIKDREECISQHLQEKKILITRLEKIFQNSIRKENETITLPKSHLTFTKWKQLYQHKKKILSNLIKTTIKAKQARGFLSIKHHVEILEKIRSLQLKQLELFLSFRSRKLKHAFHWWTHRSHQCLQGNQSKELQVFSHKLNALSMRLYKSKQSSLNKSLKFINDRKKLSILLSWKKVTRKEKTIREASETFQFQVASLKCKFAVDQWQFFTCLKLRNKEFARVMKASRLEKLEKITFYSWKNFHLTGKMIEKGLKTISYHFKRDLLTFGFHSIQTFSVHRGTHSMWFLYCREHLIKVTLNIFTKQDLLQKFKFWASRSTHIARIHSKLEKIFKTSKSRLQRKGFQSWSLKLELLKTVSKTESLGKSARSLRKLFKIKSVLEKFIKSEGLSSRFFDEYQMTHLPARLYLWSRSIDKSDFLSYRFLLWKIFYLKRQKLQFSAFRMNVFRNKGKLLQKFAIWKKYCPSFSDSIKRLPRHALIQSLALLEREERSLQESLKEKHVSLKYLESYTDILEEHVRRGQNQALARCAGQVHKTMQDCLFRWLFNTQLSRIVENDFHIRDLEQELIYSRRKCKDFDIENKELVVENKSLLTALMKAEDIIMKTTRLN